MIGASSPFFRSKSFLVLYFIRRWVYLKRSLVSSSGTHLQFEELLLHFITVHLLL